MKTGEKIKAAREKVNMSTKTIAARCDVSAATVYNWERSAYLPNRRMVETIASVVGCETAALIGDDGISQMKKPDESEKVAALNETIIKKNEKIKELEDDVLDKMEKIEELEKRAVRFGDMRELESMRKENAELSSKVMALEEENEKLKKVLFKLMLEKELGESPER